MYTKNVNVTVKELLITGYTNISGAMKRFEGFNDKPPPQLRKLPVAPPAR
jgi:hypothetical protein